MNKKTLVVVLTFFWFFSWILINYWFGEKYTEADMNAVSMWFCNEWVDNLKMVEDIIAVDPGKEKSLCLYIANNWDKKMIFEYWFTEWGTTPEWTHMCTTEASNDNKFAMLIPYTKERKVTIEAQSSQTVQENIIIPPGMSGLQLGCLVFNLMVPENTNMWGMFSMKVRKSRNLDILIWWESMVKSHITFLAMTWWSFSTNKKIFAEVDDTNNMKLSFQIKNDGNVSQNVSISWKIYNALWFQKDFVANNMISPWITTKIDVDVGILPVYKWLFNIKMNVKNDPKFLFEVLSEKLKQPWYSIETWSIFVFSRIRVIICVLILVYIIKKIFFSRKKKNNIETSISSTQTNTTI